MYLPLSFSLLPFSTSPLSFYLLSILLSEPLSSPYLFHNIISSLLLFPLSISPLSIFSLRYPYDYFSFPLSSPLLYLALSIPIYRQSFSRLSLSSFSLSISFSIVLHFSLPNCFPVSIFCSLALALTFYPFPL